MLFNPNSPEAETVASDAQTAARSVTQQIIVLTAAAEDDFDRAFEMMVQQRAGALLVGTDLTLRPIWTRRAWQRF